MSRPSLRLTFALFYALNDSVVFAAPPPELSHYRLVFSDEFNTLDFGTGEDGSNRQSHTWYEGVWFSKRHAPSDCFRTANSELALTWHRAQPQVDSSISTFSRNNPHYHAWRYGFFEVRMKWQPEPGAWPAVWLIPVQAVGDGPLESGEIGHQKLTAPDLTVRAESSSIERHADYFSGDPVLSHATGYVRMMMLDADLLHSLHLQR